MHIAISLKVLGMSKGIDEFRPGERVASNVFGKYFGVPGRVRGKSQVQYDQATRYNIELDIGKVITLCHYQIDRLEE